MFEARTIVSSAGKTDFYRDLRRQLDGLLDEERDPIANAANTSALLFALMPDLNWAGFYFLRGDELVLGPFQGKPACVRIGIGKGVCGAAAASGKSLVVEDVDDFPGHITCDAASRSELVVPLLRDGALLGVLDLDSPLVARFDMDDRLGIEAVAECYVRLSR